jgi:hypothetical protein
VAKDTIILPKVSQYFEDKNAGQRVDAVLSKLTSELKDFKSADTDAVGGVPSSEISSVAVSGIFFQAFETPVETAWLLRQAPSVLSYTANGQAGGKALNATGQAFFEFPENIPFNPDNLYRIRCKVRLVDAQTSPIDDLFSVGVQAYAADGVTLVDTSGGTNPYLAHWYAASDEDFDALVPGDWYTYTGYFSGSGAASLTPSVDADAPRFIDSAGRYIRPCFRIHHEGPATPPAANLIVHNDPTTWSIRPKITAGVDDPYGGTDAWTLTDDSTVDLVRGNDAITDTAATQKVLVFVIRKNTPATTRQTFGLFDLTAGVSRGHINIAPGDWSGYEPVTPVAAGGATMLGIWPVGNNYWALAISTDNTVVSGNNNVVYIQPAWPAAETGSIDLYRVYAFDGASLSGYHWEGGGIAEIDYLSLEVLTEGEESNQVLKDVVNRTTGKVATSKVTTDSLSPSCVTAAKIVSNTITANELDTLSGGGLTIKLDATGTQKVFEHTNFYIQADGTAVFSGTVAANIFTGSAAVFDNTIRVFASGGSGAKCEVGSGGFKNFNGSGTLTTYMHGTGITQDVGDFTLQASGDDVIINASGFDCNTSNIGFYGTTPISKQTGVAVTASAIHAALVALGLIGS